MNVSQDISQQQSLTKVNRALQHFTDRHELTKRFAEYLNDEPPPDKILFFYGDGGNGKSLLLKFLLNHGCQHFSPESWQQLKAKPSYEVAALLKGIGTPSQGRKHKRSLLDSVLQRLKHWLSRISGKHLKPNPPDWEGDCQPVPAVLLDFEEQPIDEERPQDPFYGLLILRRDLVKAAAQLGYQLNFPLTDYACVWYLKQKGKLSNESIAKLFPSPELFLSGGIINLVKTISQSKEMVIGLAGVLPILAVSTFNIVSKYFGKDLTLYLRGRGLKPEDFQRITQLDPDKELIDALPNFFVEDLNVAMQRQNAPPRIVLFLDSHEAFWGDWRSRGEARYFKQDEWLRCLLAQLDLSRIVVVVAGREKPRWHEAAQWSIPQEKLELRSVLNFQRKDAQKYLNDVGIEDKRLCEQLINYARLDEDLVHPLFLGLCADVVRSALSQGKTLTADDWGLMSEGEQKLNILVERLLKYVDEAIAEAVDALSACRAFNQELYVKLGQQLQLNPSHTGFHCLTNFSFVWLAEQPSQNPKWEAPEQPNQDWYRLHPLVRRLKAEENRQVTQDAHAFLEQYYREAGNVPEAIYHAIFQDWRRGVKEWLEVFQTATEEGNFELCRSLESIRKELSF
jgi:hypothetical protein